MEFGRHAERDGLDIYDPIENVRFALFTSVSVDPTPVDTSPFYFPVDAAVEIVTPTLEVPKAVPITVRQQDGTMVVETSDERDRTLGSDAYLVEVSTAPMKLYFLVDGRLTLSHGPPFAPPPASTAKNFIRAGAVNTCASGEVVLFGLEGMVCKHVFVSCRYRNEFENQRSWHLHWQTENF